MYAKLDECTKINIELQWGNFKSKKKKERKKKIFLKNQ